MVGEEWDGPAPLGRRPPARDRGIETSIVMICARPDRDRHGRRDQRLAVSRVEHAAEAPARQAPPTRPWSSHIPTPTCASGARGDSYVAVHRNGPGGRILFQGTLQKGAFVPFTGKSFWINVSSPENLSITVDGRPSR